jgi:hypothetical protein
MVLTSDGSDWFNYFSIFNVADFQKCKFEFLSFFEEERRGKEAFLSQTMSKKIWNMNPYEGRVL